MSSYTQCDVPGCTVRQLHFKPHADADVGQKCERLVMTFGVVPAVTLDLCPMHFDAACKAALAAVNAVAG